MLAVRYVFEVVILIFRSFVFALPVLMVGCLGSADYSIPPSGVREYGSGPRPVYSDTFKVNVDGYPKFYARENFMPPSPEDCGYGCWKLPRISVSVNDQWQVTHVFKGLYIIQSIDYNNRQCSYLEKQGEWGYGGMFGSCARYRDFGVFITPDGVINGGWALLPGSRIRGSERRTYINPSPEKNEGWPIGRLFLQKELRKPGSEHSFH